MHVLGAVVVHACVRCSLNAYNATMRVQVSLLQTEAERAKDQTMSAQRTIRLLTALPRKQPGLAQGLEPLLNSSALPEDGQLYGLTDGDGLGYDEFNGSMDQGPTALTQRMLSSLGQGQQLNGGVEMGQSHFGARPNVTASPPTPPANLSDLTAGLFETEPPACRAEGREGQSGGRGGGRGMSEEEGWGEIRDGGRGEGGERGQGEGGGERQQEGQGQQGEMGDQEQASHFEHHGSGSTNDLPRLLSPV